MLFIYFHSWLIFLSIYNLIGKQIDFKIKKISSLVHLFDYFF